MEIEIRECIARVVEGKSLSEEESFAAMRHILRGDATPAQIASLVTALRVKGEDIGEITGFARAMLEESAKVSNPGVEIVDTCGTGGDLSGTFNISTAAAFVAAGAGITVAKHGNRSVSSRCGSADVLAELGVNIMLGPAEAGECLARAGIAFLFAPVFHSAMKHAAAPRREIGIRTIFNILGPLTNPAGARRQVLGVYSEELVEKLACVLLNLGSIRAMVVHGRDGLDEISVSGETFVAELKDGRVRSYVLDPSELGLGPGSEGEISGGDSAENASRLLEVIGGGAVPGRDIVIINAAAAIACASGQKGFPEAVDAARESVDSGKALEKFELLKRVSNELRHT